VVLGLASRHGPFPWWWFEILLGIACLVLFLSLATFLKPVPDRARNENIKNTTNKKIIRVLTAVIIFADLVFIVLS